MAKSKKLTHDMVHEMVQKNLNPDKVKGNGSRPDPLRTLVEKARAKNRLILDKQTRR